jgi:hypothetical protein
MTLFELKDQCNALLGKSDFEGVFNLLGKWLNPARDVFNKKVVLLKGGHSRTLEDEMLGLITYDEAQVKYTRLAASLRQLVADLEHDDLGAGGALVDQLDKIVAELPVDKTLTPLYLVNCDRRKPTRIFWSAFDQFQQDNRRFQYYFILACPTQEPEGFSERAVYEVLDKELQDDKQSIHFRQRADERLRVDPLPLGHNLITSQKAFKKYFSERFELAHSETAFEEYLATGLPKLPWQYVATVFKITASDWDEALLGPYLHWLMDTFSHTGPNIPVFLFFFVITAKNAHKDAALSRDNREAVEDLRRFAAAHDNRAVLIEPLPPVSVDDLEDWLENLGDVSNITKRRIIDLLADRLDAEERSQYLSEQSFNMERIEELQEKIYRYHK